MFVVVVLMRMVAMVIATVVYPPVESVRVNPCTLLVIVGIRTLLLTVTVFLYFLVAVVCVVEVMLVVVLFVWGDSH
jgi:hypothetical protein